MGLKLNTASSGSVTLEPANTASNYTLTVPAQTGTVAINGPAFSAYASGAQSITASTWTKVQANVEEFDTNSCYDNSTNYRFTPNVAGYYQVNGNTETNVAVALCPSIYKNGTEFKRGTNLTGGGSTTVVTSSSVSALIYMNGSTDYIELYVYVVNSGAALAASAVYRNYFQASMVRAA